MMRLTVAKVDADPSLFRIGMENLTRWRHQNGGDQARWCEPWERWFERGEPWARIRARLLEDSDEWQRLRTSHPFAGVLTDEEREAVNDVDWDKLKRDYERRTGHPWPTTRAMVIEQFGWAGGGTQPPFAPEWRRRMDERDDPGTPGLTRVATSARPEPPARPDRIEDGQCSPPARALTGPRRWGDALTVRPVGVETGTERIFSISVPCTAARYASTISIPKRGARQRLRMAPWSGSLVHSNREAGDDERAGACRRMRDSPASIRD